MLASNKYLVRVGNIMINDDQDMELQKTNGLRTREWIRMSICV